MRLYFLSLVALVGCSDGAPLFSDAATDVPGMLAFDVPQDAGAMRDRPPTPEVIDLTDIALSADTPVARDAACLSAVSAEVTYGHDGGLVAFRYTYSLRPAATFVALKTFTDASPVRCETAVPSCNTPNEVDIDEVASALASPDVEAAFEAARANNNMVLYGVDPRPVDGQVFYVQRGGARVMVGDPCRTGGGAGCTTAPVGVQRLVDVLTALAEQERLRPACMALRN
ncbi:MAG: hypothetical protein JNK72_03140 [Myxococcales bacterium]|nr:hypothetical protein [Myxococcales bacterium]